LEDENEYMTHSTLISKIGENYMNREFRSFQIDDHNRNVLRFLTYYFNECRLAESVFSDEDYKLHKNILLLGVPGTGKTMIMQVFSDYLEMTGNGNAFHNLSVTQMMNYYKIHGHIDRYTYNEEAADGAFDGKPVNVCLNDIGVEVENQKHYGTDLDLVIDEFLYARYEIYQNQHKKYHLTSNLKVGDLKGRFGNRLVDRFKSFNVIPLSGDSRRI
jgi:hypothetical protein